MTEEGALMIWLFFLNEAKSLINNHAQMKIDPNFEIASKSNSNQILQVLKVKNLSLHLATNGVGNYNEVMNGY